MTTPAQPDQQPVPVPDKVSGEAALVAHAHVQLGKLIDEAQKVREVIERYIPPEVLQAVEKAGLSFVEQAAGGLL